MNPVSVGIVSIIEENIYSSASNYVDVLGIIDIKLFEKPKVDASITIST